MAESGRADQPPREGGERRGRGRGFGRGRGDRRGRRENKDKDGERQTWYPVTKLGRLVKEGKIAHLEEIYLHSIPVKEYQVIDHFFDDGKGLKDEVLKITPVQKQTAAGQRTRFKAYVIVGDSNGHIGMGVKCSKEVATAIRGAIILAKLSVIPVRRGYWGNKIGKPHTVPCKVTGKCGSVTVRLVPAPRGTGIVSARVPKKLLTVAGLEDVYTQAKGQCRTLGNFAKATFEAINRTYAFLTPDLWAEHKLVKTPFQEYSEFLSQPKVEKHSHREERDRERTGGDRDRPDGRGRGRGRGFRGGGRGFRGGDRYGGDRGGDRYGGGDQQAQNAPAPTDE